MKSSPETKEKKRKKTTSEILTPVKPPRRPPRVGMLFEGAPEGTATKPGPAPCLSVTPQQPERKGCKRAPQKTARQQLSSEQRPQGGENEEELHVFEEKRLFLGTPK